jgi:hypothetical protein
MAVTLNATLLFRMAWKHVDGGDLGRTEDSFKWEPRATIATGTGANQANQNYYAEGTLSSAATVDFDLAGSLSNAFGSTVTLTKIRAVGIYNVGADDGAGGYSVQASETLKVGGAGTNPITSLFDGSGTAKSPIHSGGWWFMASPGDGYTVSAGSADTLRITNAGTKTIQYRIVVMGVQ